MTRLADFSIAELVTLELAIGTYPHRHPNDDELLAQLHAELVDRGVEPLPNRQEVS